jgi:transmembrane sensor
MYKMDYSQYTVEDLASDDSFIQWAHRTNAASQEFWDDFISRHPDMRVKISQARTLVLNLRKVNAISYSDDRVNALWSKIEDHVNDSIIVPRREKSFRASAYAMAAMLGIATVALSWYAFTVSGRSEEGGNSESVVSGTDFIEEVNTSGNILRVHLSDGSTIALQNNSRVRYKKHYAGEPYRSVYLTGEAFFQVAKDPTQPFLVHANDVVTRVLGTSFWVSAPEKNGDVLVSVKTGKVSVYTVGEGEVDEESQKNAVILLPNQQAVYQRDLEAFGKSLVAQPEIVLPSLKGNVFNFENTPIGEVFRTLEKAYGIEIIFDEEVMDNCFITAPLGSEPLFDKLKIICRTIGAHYETIDAKVVVTSTGC